MPANVVCRWTKEPVNSHIWCWMQYSHACHYYLKRDGVSKTLDWLLIVMKEEHNSSPRIPQPKPLRGLSFFAHDSMTPA